MSDSKSFQELEQDDLSDIDPATVVRVFSAVTSRAEYLKDKGLSSWSFFFGVCNLLLVTWFFGVLPQHFWIIYILETLVLFTLRWRHMTAAQPLSEVLYWLDFCWVGNIVCNACLAFYLINAYFDLGALHVLSEDRVRKLLFCSFFAVSTGPLLLAVGALGNALVFHDADNTVSVFIHLCPALLLYTMRWHSEAVLAAWPGLFYLDYFDSVNPIADIYLIGVAAYFVWFVLYLLWLLTLGLHQPSRGYDTIFHCTMRSSNPVTKVLGWTEDEVRQRALSNDFTVGSALLYMVFHATACCIAMLVSMLCWSNRHVHGGLCIAMALSTIYKAAARYNFYMTEHYTKFLRKEFGPSLQQQVP